MTKKKKGYVPKGLNHVYVQAQRPQNWIIESDRTIRRNRQDDNYSRKSTKALCNCWQIQAKTQLLELLGRTVS